MVGVGASGCVRDSKGTGIFSFCLDGLSIDSSRSGGRTVELLVFFSGSMRGSRVSTFSSTVFSIEDDVGPSNTTLVAQNPVLLKVQCEAPPSVVRK